MTPPDDPISPRFESTRRTSPWFWIMTVLTIALLAAALGFMNPHCALAAILPGSVAIALLLARSGAGAITLAPDRIIIDDDPDADTAIPYGSIEGLRVDGKPVDLAASPGLASAVDVEHHGGTLRIPLGGKQRADRALRSLLERIPATGSRSVHGSLESYLNEQIRDFGPDRVYSYSTAVGLRRGKPARTAGRLVSGALLLTGIAWIALGFALAGGLDSQERGIYQAWAGWGMIFLLIGLISFAATLSGGGQSRRQAARKFKNASLVVSPLGLAVAQGDLQGHVPWDDLRSVDLRTKAPRMQLANSLTTSRIELRMKGATAEIYDIYDRPLSIIRDRIMAYWKG